MDALPLLTRCAPYLPVPDVDAAAAFYHKKMGFTVEYSAGSPAEFAIVSRDGHPIMFKRVAGSIAPNEAQGGTWDLFFWTSDADRVFAELQGSGVDVVYPVRITEYRTKEFAVRDKDGYVIGFGQEM